MAATAPGERRLHLDRPLDLGLTLSPLARGRRDPCLRITAGEAWRATRTAEGPATLLLRVMPGSATLVLRAWGPGAACSLDAAGALVGEGDDDSGLDDQVAAARAAADPAGRQAATVVRALRRKLAGLRLPRSGAVTEALVPTVLEQKVTGLEARRSYHDLVMALGEEAPGPAGSSLGLRVPPSAATLAATPGWAFHRFGVERKRADTVRLVCANARRLDEAAGMAPPDARTRIMAVRGVGPWSAAEVTLVALGDADAVSVGDYHLPNQVAWALAGEARGDDARMLDLLAPFAGQRGRVIRLVVAAGITAPRYGPRLSPRSFSRH